MASPDNKDTRPAKKMKLEEGIPNPQDGTNNENLEHPERRDFSVKVTLEEVRQTRESGEKPMASFCKIMKDAGCSESLMYKHHTSFHFIAKLTQEEANKLAGMESVLSVKPYDNFLCRSLGFA